MKGPDLYQRYNTVTNWGAVNGWADFTIIKLCNGIAKASPAGDNYVGAAKAAGIPVGGYVYALGSQSPAGTAVAFANELNRLGAFGVAPALDYEDSSLPTTAVAARAWITNFFVALKQAVPGLQYVLLYASGALMATINPSTLVVPGLTILVWDAEYGANDGVEHARSHFTGTVAIHQYTSAGSGAGITGNIDLNTLTDTRALHPLGAAMTDPMDEVVTRTDPDYTATTALTGNTTLEGVVQRFDNAIQQVEGLERQLIGLVNTITTMLTQLAAAVTANRTAEANQLAAILTAIGQQSATVSEAQIDEVVARINSGVSAETALLIGQKLVAGATS